MRKYTLAWSLVFLAFFTNGIRALSAQTPPAQSEELTKNLVRVEKPEPVPEPLAAGFKAIGAKESLALLSFLASDLLEGRETGTRGYELAAEYAASLFGLWNLKPLGDVPPPRFSLAQFLSGEPFSRQPAERTYLQEFAISEQTETSSRMNLEVRSGATVKTRSFQPGQDYTNFSPAQEFLVSAPDRAVCGLKCECIHIELFHQVGAMIFNGPRRTVQHSGDFLVTHPVCNQLQHIDFSRCQKRAFQKKV